MQRFANDPANALYIGKGYELFEKIKSHRSNFLKGVCTNGVALDASRMFSTDFS